MERIRVCIVGILGRMGQEISSELASRAEFEIVSGVDTDEAAAKRPEVEIAGAAHPRVRVFGASRVREALEKAEVYIGFSHWEAELKNSRVAASAGKKVIIGTTGFPPAELEKLKAELGSTVPAIVSSNFSIGANLMFELAKVARLLPEGYDVSVVEAHHTRKKDAPSGTAHAIAQKIREARPSYSQVLTHRPDGKPRADGELEVVAVRAGGIPGIHDIIIAGPHEMVRIEHLAFSRRAFASGVAEAARFLHSTAKPGLYDVAEALINLSQSGAGR
jgi:4-hydroxy-tetrahydrodipicolinate reductase